MTTYSKKVNLKSFGKFRFQLQKVDKTNVNQKVVAACVKGRFQKKNHGKIPKRGGGGQRGSIFQ